MTPLSRGIISSGKLGGGVIPPENPITANMVFNIRADDGFIDLSTIERPFANINTVGITPNAINGRSAFDFNGTNYLEFDTKFTLARYHVFAIFNAPVELTSSSNGYRVLGGQDVSAGGSVQVTFGGSVTTHLTNEVISTLNYAGPALNKFYGSTSTDNVPSGYHLIEEGASASSDFIAVDGVTKSISQAVSGGLHDAPLGALVDLKWIAHVAGTTSPAFELAELIVYSELQTGQNLTDIRTYINDRYGI